MIELDENHAVRFGEFALEPREKRVVGPAGQVRMGRKASRLLTALIERSGSLLTKDVLFETVRDGTRRFRVGAHGHNQGAPPRSRRRSKDPRFIESVYGRGYRFIAPVTAVETHPASPALTVLPTSEHRPPETEPSHSPQALRRTAAVSRRALAGWGCAAIGTAVAGVLIGRARQRETMPTEVEALVAHARQLMDSNLTVGQNEAIGLLRRAVDLAPHFADGWGLLGLAYAIPSHFRERREGLMLRARARAAADRALELDPGNALGEMARGVELPFVGHWRERDRRLDGALARSPEDGDVLTTVGSLLQFSGSASAAVPFFERVKQRPFTPGTYSDYVHALWSAGRIDEAERAADDATRLYPTQQTLWYDQYRILLASGRADAAVALVKDLTARPLTVDSTFVADLLAHAEAVGSPRAPQARRTLMHALADAHLGEFEAEAAIRLAGLLGDRDAGFAVAEAFYFSRGFVIPDHASWGTTASLDQRDTRLLFEPEFASIRSDPRFERLVAGLASTLIGSRRMSCPTTASVGRAKSSNKLRSQMTLRPRASRVSADSVTLAYRGKAPTFHWPIPGSRQCLPPSGEGWQGGDVR